MKSAKDNNMKQNIFALGDSTYDIAFKDGKPIFAKTGGSVVNTSISLARLGCKVSLITLLANDEIGRISRKFLEENGVNTGLTTSFDGNSKLALAFLKNNNDAQYSFYDGRMDKQVSLKFPAVEEDSIVLFGSSFAVRENHRHGLVEYLEKCTKQGNLIYYDPNVRQAYLNSGTRKYIFENIKMAKIIKGSIEDFQLLFDTIQSHEIHQNLKKINPEAILIITTGKNPVKLYLKDAEYQFKVPEIKPVSTIGAGDTINAGVIYGLLQHLNHISEVDRISAADWKKIINYTIEMAIEVCLSNDNYISKKKL